MGFFYIDESIHDRAGFIVAAVVFSEQDPSARIDEALRAVGLTPGQHEFKSGERMDSDESRRRLRNEMKEILQGTRLGLVVVPRSERHRLGNHVLDGLRKIVQANRLKLSRHNVCFDEGIEFERAVDAITNFRLAIESDVYTQQNSRTIRGLQLADLASHTMAIMLLDQLGIQKKTVKAGPESGYEPDMDIELGFEMWATVRYLFFTQDQIRPYEDQVTGFTLKTAEYALHVPEVCSPKLAQATLARFGETYVGCIH